MGSFRTEEMKPHYHNRVSIFLPHIICCKKAVTQHLLHLTVSSFSFHLWVHSALTDSMSPVPLSPALYHSRKKFYQVSCDLPANERPVRLSNSTLPKFNCRHIPLHWRSLVSSDSCAKNGADQLSLWDKFGILSGKCWVSCDLTWCHRTWLRNSCWLWSNPHDPAEVRGSTGTSLVVLGPAVLLSLACANAQKGQSHSLRPKFMSCELHLTTHPSPWRPWSLCAPILPAVKTTGHPRACC